MFWNAGIHCVGRQVERPDPITIACCASTGRMVATGRTAPSARARRGRAGRSPWPGLEVETRIWMSGVGVGRVLAIGGAELEHLGVREVASRRRGDSSASAAACSVWWRPKVSGELGLAGVELAGGDDGHVGRGELSSRPWSELDERQVGDGRISDRSVVDMGARRPAPGRTSVGTAPHRTPRRPARARDCARSRRRVADRPPAPRGAEVERHRGRRGWCVIASRCCSSISASRAGPNPSSVVLVLRWCDGRLGSSDAHFALHVVVEDLAVVPGWPTCVTNASGD